MPTKNLNSAKIKIVPKLDPKLFWDVKYTPSSIKKYPAFVLERVLQRGSNQDFAKVLSYLGKEQAKNVLLHNDRFSPETKAFIKIYFNLTDKDLCSLRPSFPKLWEY
jgi:hypothetical protein